MDTANMMIKNILALKLSGRTISQKKTYNSNAI